MYSISKWHSTLTSFQPRLRLRDVGVVHEDEPAVELPADLDVLDDVLARELAAAATPLHPPTDAAVVAARAEGEEGDLRPRVQLGRRQLHDEGRELVLHLAEVAEGVGAVEVDDDEPEAVGRLGQLPPPVTCAEEPLALSAILPGNESCSIFNGSRIGLLRNSPPLRHDEHRELERALLVLAVDEEEGILGRVRVGRLQVEADVFASLVPAPKQLLAFGRARPHRSELLDSPH